MFSLILSKIFLALGGFSADILASQEVQYLPVIFAVQGSELSPDEVAFFEKYRPVGAILSTWNVEHDARGQINWGKLQKLCSDIRLHSLYILVDQEGGRVQHLKGAGSYVAPAPRTFAEGVSGGNFAAKCEALRQNVQAIDGDLRRVGINVNCAPVCDLLFDDVPSFIGDRSFGTNPDVVQKFAITWAEQAARDGIIPVLKHCPGHGSTAVDTHLNLPTISKSFANLEQSDFKIFKTVIGALEETISEDNFWVMTAHIVYLAIDADHCATQSPAVIRMIREQFGFRGKIVTDCICMKALEGEWWERAVASLGAGCDYVLCCSADLKKKEEIAEKVRKYLAAKGPGGR
jgi:beta-N-acetylhexosaminidase